MFSPDGKWVARFGYGPEVRLLRALNGAVAATLQQSVGPIRYAVFSRDSRFLIAASDDCRLLIWDVIKVRALGGGCWWLLPRSTVFRPGSNLG